MRARRLFPFSSTNILAEMLWRFHHAGTVDQFVSSILLLNLKPLVDGHKPLSLWEIKTVKLPHRGILAGTINQLVQAENLWDTNDPFLKINLWECQWQAMISIHNHNIKRTYNIKVFQHWLGPGLPQVYIWCREYME